MAKQPLKAWSDDEIGRRAAMPASEAEITFADALVSRDSPMLAELLRAGETDLEEAIDDGQTEDIQ